MLKVLINEEEVLTNKDFTIKKEMLNTPSVILNNVYPKSWEDEKDYTSNFYHPQDYSKCKIIDESIVPADPGETITGTSFTIEDNDNTKLNELTELEGNTTQSGTPTPDSPQPINVVSGRQEVDVVGKNLLKFSNDTNTRRNQFTYITETPELVVCNKNESGSNFYAKYEIYIEQGQKYTLSVEDTSVKTFYGYSDDLWGTAVSGLSNKNVSKSVPFKFTASYTGNLVIGFYGDYNYNPLTLTKPMIEKGQTATTFEEYKGQSYEINLGKNLYYMNYNDTTYSNFNGVDITSTHTGYSISGTATSNTAFTLTNRYITLPAGTYTMSLKEASSMTIRLSKTNYSGITAISIGQTSATFTLIEETKVCLTLVITNGTTYNEENEVMIEKGTQATTYAPYKTPIELCKINTYKDMIFRGKGVNLFDKDTILTNKIINASGEIIDTNNYIVGDFIEVKPNTQYTISFTSTNTELLRIGYYKNDKTYIERPTSAENPWTITTPSNCYYIRVCTPSVYQNVMVNEGSTALPYEPYNSKGKWLLHKEIGKVVLNGSENWSGGTIAINYLYVYSNTYDNILLPNMTYTGISTHFKVLNQTINYYSPVITTDSMSLGSDTATAGNRVRIKINKATTNTLANFKTWLSTHNVEVYYVLATPTTTEITDSELISQLNSIELLEGLNNVSVSSGDLPGEITIHYNYTEEQTIDDLLFCGVVKNSGNISLNPREPHFQSLQILDFKTFLSEGELDSFVIYQKTILEAIQMVIANIQDYGFILGNVNILNPTDVIGAYSTKNKTAYDVFNYLADITQSRWTTRLIDENHVAIDFYDPTLMIEGTPINYTQAFFENNLIDDMTYSYGSNNYRNKQVMTSSQVYSNISQQQSIVANGYQTQFPTEQPIGKINSITSNGIPLTFATFNEKEMGYVADFYYSPGDNYFESEDLRTTGEILIIDYVAIVEGRQIITNPLEIDRINDSTGRKGIISRYEQRNDATTSTELQKIGESYIKYKGTPEIKLKISTRKNIWEVGQRVQFNAPIEDLDTEYMVRTKKINYIATIDTIFYEYELISSFNSETEINYFDNQRAKASGNIGEGEYISRNIDIESTANIIFYDTETTEVQVDGDNVLNSILNSPFTS